MSDTVTCHHIGCKEEVTKTTDNLCGGHTGEDEHSCGQVYCSTHLECAMLTNDGQIIYICDKCEERLLDTEEWYKDPIEECLIKILG